MTVPTIILISLLLLSAYSTQTQIKLPVQATTQKQLNTALKNLVTELQTFHTQKQNATSLYNVVDTTYRCLEQVKKQLNQYNNVVIGQNNKANGSKNLIVGNYDTISGSNNFVFIDHFDGYINGDLLVGKWRVELDKKDFIKLSPSFAIYFINEEQNRKFQRYLNWNRGFSFGSNLNTNYITIIQDIKDEIQQSITTELKQNGFSTIPSSQKQENYQSNINYQSNSNHLSTNYGSQVQSTNEKVINPSKSYEPSAVPLSYFQSSNNLSQQKPSKGSQSPIKNQNINTGNSVNLVYQTSNFVKSSESSQSSSKPDSSKYTTSSESKDYANSSNKPSNSYAPASDSGKSYPTSSSSSNNLRTDDSQQSQKPYNSYNSYMRSNAGSRYVRGGPSVSSSYLNINPGQSSSYSTTQSGSSNQYQMTLNGAISWNRFFN